MTHVAICSDGIFPAEIGGMQRHTDLLVRSLAGAHPELAISVLHTHTGRRLFADLPGVTEIDIAPRPGRRQYLLECYDLSGRMAAALRRVPDAVVYAQGLTVWKNAREFGHRLINNPHGLEAFQAITLRDKAIGFPFSHAFRSIWRQARHVVSLGGRLTTILYRYVPEPERRVVVLPNGVRLPEPPCERSTGPRTACTMLFVGRFAANKGIADLLQAMTLLASDGKVGDFQLHLVGTGPLFAALEAAYRLPNVVFHGAVDDATLHRLYCESDVFVLPTLFEGMPTVVLEAMARGLPILVTDVGATRELVDERNGMIIPKRAPRQLADAIGRFAALPREVRDTMGMASLEKVRQRFTWDRVADAHGELFSRLTREINGTQRART